MKFSKLATAAALAVSVEAQFPGFNFFNFGRPTALPTAFAIPTNFAVPSQFASYASQAASIFGAGNASPTSKVGNTALAPGQTVTAAATAYGNEKTVVPTVPTASASSVAPPAASVSASGNSSAAALTVVSTSQDALNNPSLPNGPTHRGNWAPGFDINTDASTSWPNTGNVVKYTLTISNGTCAPQGDSKLCFLINGQYPGPLIQANWGDTLQITVVNQLQNNGTSLHFHGCQQKNSNPQDGVNGVTECPLAPGDTKTYTFVATSYGPSWYHSHFSGQYAEGVFGPLLINGPTSANYDIDLGSLMISDYYPLTGFQELYLAQRFGPPTATNYLLNGQNAKVDGSAGTRTKFTFTPGKKHKISVINTSAASQYKFQIDGHQLWVVSTDFVAITPYMTTELSVNIGQRYQVIVVANQPSASYWMRGMIAADCTLGSNTGTGTANGIIAYANATSSALPSSSPWPHSDACVDESLGALVPVCTKSVDSTNFAGLAVTEAVSANVLTTVNDTTFQWTIGGISQVIDWSNPTLTSAVNAVDTFTAVKHVISLTTPNIWTYWVIQNAFSMSHPMHLHGHDFAILGSGSGTFNAASNAGQLNFKNPNRRDVVTLTARGWTVIAFQTDNPGAWLMHCHISWHVSGGLSLQYLERPADIPALYSSVVTSQAFTNTCSNWDKYAAKSIYKQSDSGLKKREQVGDVTMDMEIMDVMPERREEARNVKAHMHNHVRRHVSHWV